MKRFLTKTFSFYKEQPKDKREAFDHSKFNFDDFDRAAQQLYFEKRKAIRRPDVKVVGCFYFPGTRDYSFIMLPHRYFPPSAEHKFWAVVCFYGSLVDARIRGYLPIQHLIHSSGSTWDFTKEHKLHTLEKGAQVGPLPNDVAWENMEVVSTKYLLDTLPAASDIAPDGKDAADAPEESRKRDHSPSRVKSVTRSKLPGDPPPPEAVKSRDKRLHWKEGDKLDYRDDGQWYGTTIKSVNSDADMILLTFDEYGPEFDKWVPRDSLALAPHGKFSAKKKKAGTSDEADEKRLQSFLNGQKQTPLRTRAPNELETELKKATALIQQLSSRQNLASPAKSAGTGGRSVRADQGFGSEQDFFDMPAEAEEDADGPGPAGENAYPVEPDYIEDRWGRRFDRLSGAPLDEHVDPRFGRQPRVPPGLPEEFAMLSPDVVLEEYERLLQQNAELQRALARKARPRHARNKGHFSDDEKTEIEDEEPLHSDADVSRRGRRRPRPPFSGSESFHDPYDSFGYPEGDTDMDTARREEEHALAALNVSAASEQLLEVQAQMQAWHADLEEWQARLQMLDESQELDEEDEGLRAQEYEQTQRAMMELKERLAEVDRKLAERELAIRSGASGPQMEGPNGYFHDELQDPLHGDMPMPSESLPLDPESGLEDPNRPPSESERRRGGHREKDRERERQRILEREQQWSRAWDPERERRERELAARHGDADPALSDKEKEKRRREKSRDRRSKDKERESDKDRSDRDRDRDRDREAERGRSREVDKEDPQRRSRSRPEHSSATDKLNGRDSSRERRHRSHSTRDKPSSRDKDKDRRKHSERDRDRDRERDHGKEKERGRERDRDRERDPTRRHHRNRSAEDRAKAPNELDAEGSTDGPSELNSPAPPAPLPASAISPPKDKSNDSLSRVSATSPSSSTNSLNKHAANANGAGRPQSPSGQPLYSPVSASSLAGTNVDEREKKAQEALARAAALRQRMQQQKDQPRSGPSPVPSGPAPASGGAEFERAKGEKQQRVKQLLERRAARESSQAGAN